MYILSINKVGRLIGLQWINVTCHTHKGNWFKRASFYFEFVIELTIIFLFIFHFHFHITEQFTTSGKWIKRDWEHSVVFGCKWMEKVMNDSMLIQRIFSILLNSFFFVLFCYVFFSFYLSLTRQLKCFMFRLRAIGLLFSGFLIR